MSTESIIATRKDIGTRLKSFREQLNFSQTKLAEKSGLNQSKISGIEQGSINYTIQNFLKYLNALETTVYLQETSSDGLSKVWIDINSENCVEKLGLDLCNLRKLKGVNKSIMGSNGLRHETIDSIEKGTANYTIDNLIKYLASIKFNIYLKEGSAFVKVKNPVLNYDTITPEFLLHRGFQKIEDSELANDPDYEDEQTYGMDLHPRLKKLAPEYITGKFNEHGDFELQNYGIIETPKELDNILKAIETLANNKLENILITPIM